MKNLLVTGAAGGIGSEIATSASKKGYRVGLIDQDSEKLKEVEAKIENSISLPADITKEESVKQALDIFGDTPDGLVNCAGIVRFGSLLDQKIEDFEDVINVNLLGCFIVSCSVARLMKKNGSGNIINISSISGGKAAAVDFKILEKYCKKGSKALRLAKRSRKKHGYGTRKVRKVKI